MIKPFQVADTLERWTAERCFAVEGVEYDAFEEVAEAEVMVLGEGFEHLEDALFNAHAGLNALDENLSSMFHCLYQCTTVHLL